MSELVPLTKEQAGYAERGLSVVRSLARVFARDWPSLPESDFVSAGHEAVVRAATRFRPERGVPFEQYVKHVTYGTMLDLAHREVFVRGQVRRVLRVLAEPIVVDDPTDAWLEPQTTSGHDEVVTGLRARAAHFAAAALAESAAARTPEDLLVEEAEERTTRETLRAFVSGLADDERAFVRMHYDEERGIGEIAAHLGVVPRTVRRMRERIKERLVRAFARAGSA